MRNPIRGALALVVLACTGMGSVAAAGPAGPVFGGMARTLAGLADQVAAGLAGVAALAGLAWTRLEALLRGAAEGAAPALLLGMLAGIGAAALLAALVLILAFSRHRPPSRPW